MGLFKNILKENESLFKNHLVLDNDFIPKITRFRENEQRTMINCIKPLLADRNGRNLIISGKPGIGKTLTCKKVLEALDEEDGVNYDGNTIYVNCWKVNTTYKIMLELCSQLEYPFTQNKNTDDLFTIIKQKLNKKSTIFVFDEIDKIEDFNFLYMILEDIYRKTVFMICNQKEFLLKMDQRLKSRLMPEIIDFKQYNLNETTQILKTRKDQAFFDEVWEEDAFDMLARKTYEIGDIRSGLFLLKEAGSAAEENSLKKISKEYSKIAISKLDKFSIKGSDTLKNETRFIFSIIKKHPESKIGDLFRIYQKGGGIATYKTFQRNIKKLQQDKFISVKKIEGGIKGTTSIIKPIMNKKLNDF